jgi:hypothetical protein
VHPDGRDDGLVTVDPKVVLTVPGFDDALLALLPDSNVSIENSVAFDDGVAYFANSGGLVQGWDISRVLNGGRKADRVFRFWTGEDTDASVVIDEDGFLYVASELERFTARAQEVGQLMKLDPRRSKDPIVWSFPITERGSEGAGGAGPRRCTGRCSRHERGDLIGSARDWPGALADPPGRADVVLAGGRRRRAAPGSGVATRTHDVSRPFRNARTGRSRSAAAR